MFSFITAKIMKYHEKSSHILITREYLRYGYVYKGEFVIWMYSLQPLLCNMN